MTPLLVWSTFLKFQDSYFYKEEMQMLYKCARLTPSILGHDVINHALREYPPINKNIMKKNFVIKLSNLKTVFETALR